MIGSFPSKEISRSSLLLFITRPGAPLSFTYYFFFLAELLKGAVPASGLKIRNLKAKVRDHLVLAFSDPSLS